MIKNKFKKIEHLEKILTESFRRRQTVQTDDQWQKNVMDVVWDTETAKYGLKPDSIRGQAILIWRFSGIAAAVSLFIVILFLSLGNNGDLNSVLALLADPAQWLTIGLLGI